MRLYQSSKIRLEFFGINQHSISVGSALLYRVSLLFEDVTSALINCVVCGLK